MCGPRVPCLQTLLPPQSTHDPLPRTRQQVRIANGHSFQLSSTLPPRSQNAVRRSFPYLYIPTWNSLPPSVLRELSLKQLQRFKSEAYKYFLKNNWMWAPKLTLSTLPDYEPLTLCEATARSTKLRKMQFNQSVFYQKNEALLFITNLPCLKVFASLITKNTSKSSWHTEKFAKNCLKEKSSGRMRTKRQNRKVCSFLRSISSSPGH